MRGDATLFAAATRSSRRGRSSTPVLGPGRRRPTRRPRTRPAAKGPAEAARCLRGDGRRWRPLDRSGGGRGSSPPTPRPLAAAGGERLAERIAAAPRPPGPAPSRSPGGPRRGQVYARSPAPRSLRRCRWVQVYLVFGDERCVPPDDPASNFRMACEALFARAGAARPDRACTASRPSGRTWTRPPRTTTPPRRTRSISCSWASGEDGHTASLFPGSPALDERQARVAVVTGPEGRPTRRSRSRRRSSGRRARSWSSRPGRARPKRWSALSWGRWTCRPAGAARAARHVDRGRAPPACFSSDHPEDLRGSPGYRRSQCSTGRSRNSSTGMPSAPTSSLRCGWKASENAASPGSASRERPLLTSIAVRWRPARHDEVDLAVAVAPVEQLARPEAAALARCAPPPTRRAGPRTRARRGSPRG